MSKELMEMLKLIDYKFDEKHRTNPFTLDAYIDGWKHCKSEMLEIIESYKPKVLDQPDSEGWWWVYDDIGDWRICQVHEGSGINGNDWDYPMWADKGDKWIKVEVPEKETKGDNIPYGYA